MTLFLAILWTISLFLNFFACCAGNAPSWWAYICTLLVVVFEYWEKYFDERCK